MGANISFLAQNLDGSNAASAFAADLGSLVHFGESGFSAGAAIQRLGTQISGADLPLNVRAGLGYQGKLAELDRMSLAVDLNAPLADSQASSVSVGMEFWYHDALALRGGYKLVNQSQLGDHAGLSAGVGAHYRWMKLDYAYTSLGDLGSGNLVSLGASF